MYVSSQAVDTRQIRDVCPVVNTYSQQSEIEVRTTLELISRRSLQFADDPR
jgi:hypothetical protein